MSQPQNTGLFGLLSYKGTDNIGDEIQSLAARRFLPSCDDFIEREATDSYHPADGNRRSVIMNGWYSHSPEHWPPSRFINPLFVSVHITEDAGAWSGLKAKDIMLAEPVAKYLRSYAPIGARDLNTLKLLQNAGIEAYFSGCMTLTIERPDVPRDDNLIVFNDLPEEFAEKLRATTKKEIKTTQHSGIKIANQAERFDAAKKLLETYASASCVVTRRLHCALPCVAMGTPVLMINTAHDMYRFAGLSEFIRNETPEQIKSGTWAYDINNPPANFDLHLPYRQDLIKKCKAFIASNLEGDNAAPYPLTYSEDVAIKSYILGKTSAALIAQAGRARRFEWQLKKLGAKPV